MINISENIRKWLILPLLALITACGVTKPHTVTNEIRYVYKDSTIFHVIDSIRTIPIEKIINKTLPDQKSSLETSLAKSEAYTDSLGFLHHTLENKKQFSQHVHKEEKEKVKIDSIYIKVPVPYEVEKPVKYIPKFYKFTLWYFIGTIIIIILYFFLKHFRKRLYL